MTPQEKLDRIYELVKEHEKKPESICYDVDSSYISGIYTGQHELSVEILNILENE